MLLNVSNKNKIYKIFYIRLIFFLFLNFLFINFKFDYEYYLLVYILFFYQLSNLQIVTIKYCNQKERLTILSNLIFSRLDLLDINLNTIFKIDILFSNKYFLNILYLTRNGDFERQSISLNHFNKNQIMDLDTFIVNNNLN